jgi:hypothetical protein
MTGTRNSINNEGYVLELLDGGTPTFSWGIWLGTDAADLVNNLVVNGDEIYAVGQTSNTVMHVNPTGFQGTIGTGHDSDLYVVEIADGGTPTIVWGQYIGGVGLESYSIKAALAINGDQIYVGGYSVDSQSWKQ